MEKVKISKERAEALELMKAKGEERYSIVYSHARNQLTQVKGWESIHTLSGEYLIRALYIGYEVEGTPEDKVRTAYNRAIQIFHDEHRATDYQNGMHKVLEILNIKIEGVNT